MVQQLLPNDLMVKSYTLASGVRVLDSEDRLALLSRKGDRVYVTHDATKNDFNEIFRRLSRDEFWTEGIDSGRACGTADVLKKLELCGVVWSCANSVIHRQDHAIGKIPSRLVRLFNSFSTKIALHNTWFDSVSEQRLIVFDSDAFASDIASALEDFGFKVKTVSFRPDFQFSQIRKSLSEATMVIRSGTWIDSPERLVFQKHMSSIACPWLNLVIEDQRTFVGPLFSGSRGSNPDEFCYSCFRERRLSNLLGSETSPERQRRVETTLGLNSMKAPTAARWNSAIAGSIAAQEVFRWFSKVTPAKTNRGVIEVDFRGADALRFHPVLPLPFCDDCQEIYADHRR